MNGIVIRSRAPGDIGARRREDGDDGNPKSILCK